MNFLNLQAKQVLFSAEKPVNRTFLLIVSTIIILGAIAFFSASFGLLSRAGASFSSVIFSQLVLGLLPGIFLAWLLSRFHYTNFRRFALIIFLLTIAFNLLLYIPALGFEHGGALRWLQIGPFTIQPSEFLKIAFILYMASWLSGSKDKIKDYRFGILPFFLILGATVLILLLQRDTDNAVIITLTALIMYFAMGARIRDIAVVVLIACISLPVLFYMRPYLMDRVLTFFNPSRNQESSSYQLNKSLIAIGSGEIFGRGFGQSVQKFSGLPEPIGDSIFAVIGEEFGLIGGILIILLFTLFLLQGLRISIRSPDSFGRLLTLGIVILITAQSFMNIASMLGIFPLSGLPLIFISHGGTSMLVSLAAIGLVFNVSRYAK